MHLLDIDPAFLTLEHFNQRLEAFKEGPLEEVTQFVQLYLTDDDLDLHKHSNLDKLILAARVNLRNSSGMSRLLRKAKVCLYLQKK